MALTLPSQAEGRRLLGANMRRGFLLGSALPPARTPAPPPAWRGTREPPCALRWARSAPLLQTGKLRLGAAASLRRAAGGGAQVLRLVQGSPPSWPTLGTELQGTVSPPGWDGQVTQLARHSGRVDPAGPAREGPAQRSLMALGRCASWARPVLHSRGCQEAGASVSRQQAQLSLPCESGQRSPRTSPRLLIFSFPEKKSSVESTLPAPQACGGPAAHQPSFCCSLRSSGAQSPPAALLPQTRGRVSESLNAPPFATIRIR